MSERIRFNENLASKGITNDVNREIFEEEQNKIDDWKKEVKDQVINFFKIG